MLNKSSVRENGSLIISRQNMSRWSCECCTYNVLSIEKTQGQGGEIFDKMLCVFMEWELLREFTQTGGKSIKPILLILTEQAGAIKLMIYCNSTA